MAKDLFTKKWIIETGIPIIENYGSELTLRSLYYRLVAAGMTNSQNHYKRVVNAMIEARWNGDVLFEAFKDHERESIGETKYEITSVESETESSFGIIEHVMNRYKKNRWENQIYYPEVWIEKKALQGLFEPICSRWDVSLNPCKGYPSLTFQYDAKERFEEARYQGKKPIILYFGDYDCSGEDIPRSIKETLERMGCEIEVKRIALMEHQVLEWNLPPAPSKETDTRSSKWEGLGQVELDAVDPKVLKKLIDKSLFDILDIEKYEELKSDESNEKEEYKTLIKNKVIDLT